MPAPVIRIDSRSENPAVRQIVDQFRVLLVDGVLAPGTGVPSVRRLAMDLGVHFNTVAEAYRILSSEGWLELKHGSGARVAERRSPLANRDRVQEFRRRLRYLIAQMRSEGIPNAKIVDELRTIAEGIAG
jgi:GntR family transcriptional regulator